MSPGGRLIPYDKTHTIWEEVKVHTAKCERCKLNNDSSLYRCAKCSRHICSRCTAIPQPDGHLYPGETMEVSSGCYSSTAGTTTVVPTIVPDEERLSLRRDQRKAKPKPSRLPAKRKARLEEVDTDNEEEDSGYQPESSAMGGKRARAGQFVEEPRPSPVPSIISRVTRARDGKVVKIPQGRFHTSPAKHAAAVKHAAARRQKLENATTFEYRPSAAERVPSIHFRTPRNEVEKIPSPQSRASSMKQVPTSQLTSSDPRTLDIENLNILIRAVEYVERQDSPRQIAPDPKIARGLIEARIGFLREKMLTADMAELANLVSEMADLFGRLEATEAPRAMEATEPKTFKEALGAMEATEAPGAAKATEPKTFKEALGAMEATTAREATPSPAPTESGQGSEFALEIDRPANGKTALHPLGAKDHGREPQPGDRYRVQEIVRKMMTVGVNKLQVLGEAWRYGYIIDGTEERKMWRLRTGDESPRRRDSGSSGSSSAAGTEIGRSVYRKGDLSVTPLGTQDLQSEPHPGDWYQVTEILVKELGGIDKRGQIPVEAVWRYDYQISGPQGRELFRMRKGQ